MLKLQFSDNRQPALWIVDDVFRIGSDIKNQVRIIEHGILPLHAIIRQNGPRLTIEPAEAGAPLRLNGQPVAGPNLMQVGDRIQIAAIELILIDPTRQQVAPVPVVNRVAAPDSVTAQPVISAINWEVKVMTGAMSGRIIAVREPLTIGRDPSSDIVISGQHVSRRHAQFMLRGNELWVKDLGSSNGTYVNSQKVMERSLYLGDEIKFDAITFRVVTGSQPPDLVEASNPMDKTQFRPALHVPPIPEPVVLAPPTIAPAATPLPQTAVSSQIPPIPPAPQPEDMMSGATRPQTAQAPRATSFNLIAMMLLVLLVIGVVLLGINLLR